MTPFTGQISIPQQGYSPHNRSTYVIAASSVAIPPLAGRFKHVGQAFPVSVAKVLQHDGRFCAAPALSQPQPASGCSSI